MKTNAGCVLDLAEWGSFLLGRSTVWGLLLRPLSSAPCVAALKVGSFVSFFPRRTERLRNAKGEAGSGEEWMGSTLVGQGVGG
jgi:hypothetical protein